MYPFIKVKDKNRKTIFRAFIIILCVLIGLWWLSSGLETQLNSAIVVQNTEYVEQDTSKIKVEHINEDGTVFLENTTSVEDDAISEYITVKQGVGTYYIPDNMMTRELTANESFDLGQRFIFLSVLVYLVFQLLGVNAKGKRSFTILLILGELIVAFFASIVLTYFLNNIVESKFPVNWLLFGLSVEYVIFMIILYILKKKGKIFKNVN
jgi:hypothetical protein